MSRYRYTGLTPGVLADGRPVAPGQDISITADALEQPDNQSLVDDGVLQEIPAAPAKSGSTKKSEVA